MAEEFAPFRLTGVEGQISLRYLFDEETVGTVGGKMLRQTRPTYEQEIFVQGHGYIYHPNFLKLDVGGGPVLVQQTLESDGQRDTSRDTLYNFSGRLTFLEQKPYPLVLYYERLNPSVSLGLADRFRQDNTKYGLNFTLRQPVSPVLLNLDAFRLRSEGQGFSLIMDETTDQASVRAFRDYGVFGYGQILLQTIRQESRSGSPQLPIQASTTSTHNLNFDSVYTFGARRQFNLTTVSSYSAQEYSIAQASFPARNDFRFNSYLRWEHSDTLQSFYRYNLVSSRQGPVDTNDQSAALGVSHRGKNLFTSAELHGERNQGSDFSSRLYGATGSLTYRRPAPLGSLQLSYGARYDRKDQESAAAQINVIGEHAILTGTTLVTLSRDFVVPSTVVVSNLGRSQIYAEGSDYQLTTVGAKTQIQRLASGGIVDGQEVLVDYAFQSGGTFGYTLLDQNVQGNWGLGRYFNLFARYRNATQKVVSGLPTLPLNSVRSTLYGARMDLPLRWWGMLVGGEVSRERQNEDIAPFQRQSYDAYSQISLPLASTLRVSGRRTHVDNLNSPQDVNLSGMTVLLQSRPWFRTTVSAEADYEKDTGGLIPRSRWNDTLRAEWRVRQLILSVEGRFAREEQGVFEREKKTIRAVLRRDF